MGGQQGGIREGLSEEVVIMLGSEAEWEVEEELRVEPCMQWTRHVQGTTGKDEAGVV